MLSQPPLIFSMLQEHVILQMTTEETYILQKKRRERERWHDSL
jgi:hypothetical protein